MNVFKLFLFAVVGIVLYHHRDSLSHLGTSPEERAEELEHEIQMTNQNIASEKDRIAKAPLVGTVVSRAARGATETVSDNGTDRMKAEVADMEADLGQYEAELKKCGRKSARNTGTERGRSG